METPNDIEEKQDFLRREIIDQNYDPNDFLCFLQNATHQDEIDLNNYTIDDLKNLCIEFKSQKSPGTPINLNVDTSEPKIEKTQEDIFDNKSAAPVANQFDNGNSNMFPSISIDDNIYDNIVVNNEDNNDVNKQENISENIETKDNSEIKDNVIIKDYIDKKERINNNLIKKEKEIEKNKKAIVNILEEIQCLGPEKSKLSDISNITVTLSL